MRDRFSTQPLLLFGIGVFVYAPAGQLLHGLVVMVLSAALLLLLPLLVRLLAPFLLLFSVLLLPSPQHVSLRRRCMAPAIGGVPMPLSLMVKVFNHAHKYYSLGIRLYFGTIPGEKPQPVFGSSYVCEWDTLLFWVRTLRSRKRPSLQPARCAVGTLSGTCCRNSVQVMWD